MFFRATRAGCALWVLLGSVTVVRCAWSQEPEGTQTARCGDPAREPITQVALPGNPFQAIPTSDGCHIFVSLSGKTEPGSSALRRAAQPAGSHAGIAVLRRANGAVRVARVVSLDGSPTGMVLTHDGQLLVVTSDDRVAFVDAAALIAGSEPAVLKYWIDAPSLGRAYANVTRDDRYLFLSDETAGTITVVDLRAARASGFDTSAVVGRIPVGLSPVALTFSPDERYLYTTSQAAPRAYGWPLACRRQGVGTEGTPPDHARGAILVVDVARAISDPTHAVVGAVAAGCNPVRLITSPAGDVAYVTARTDNALLAFDTSKLLADSAHALIGRVPVGIAPVGVAVVAGGTRVIVANSNRFGTSPTDRQSLTVIDAERIPRGANAVLGTIPAGAFPRELRLTADGRTLLVTNYASRTLELIDLARVPSLRGHP